MKKSKILPWLLLGLVLLSGCGAVTDSTGNTCKAEPSTEVSEPLGVLFRVVDERNSSLLLSKVGGDTWDVYTLSLKDVPLTLDGAAFDLEEPGAYQDLPARSLEGAVLEVAYGSVQETYPAHLSEVTAINIRSADFDDRCALYRQVLEDLWNADPALNDGTATVSVDLSQTSLTPGEQEAVAVAFSWDHAISEYLTLSYQALQEGGYLDCADEHCDGIPHWEEGVLLSISEKADRTASLHAAESGLRQPTPAESGDTQSNSGASNFGKAVSGEAGMGNVVVFDAEKWRSALGAYFLTDCTATQNSMGHWDGYSVGASLIS